MWSESIGGTSFNCSLFPCLFLVCSQSKLTLSIQSSTTAVAAVPLAFFRLSGSNATEYQFSIKERCCSPMSLSSSFPALCRQRVPSSISLLHCCRSRRTLHFVVQLKCYRRSSGLVGLCILSCLCVPLSGSVCLWLSLIAFAVCCLPLFALDNCVKRLAIPSNVRSVSLYCVDRSTHYCSSRQSHLTLIISLESYFHRKISNFL